jgi:sugar phosphate isomerase/epimerase
VSKLKFACHLIQFGGEEKRDLEGVLRAVADAGWEGVEGLGAADAEELVAKATLARHYGLHAVNVHHAGGDAVQSVKYNITLGNGAAEVPARARRDWGGDRPSDADFERAARSLDDILAFCRQHGVKGFHHAHLRTLIETTEDAERLLVAAPDLYLLYDTGHLLAGGSDPLDVFRSDRLRSRIAHVHLKDFHADDPATWDHRTQKFGEKGRFAELGQGNFGLDVKAVLGQLAAIGYDGWVAAELDWPFPPKSAAEAAKANREYLRGLGY